MNLSAQFREYLLNQSNPSSKVTVKNYISDVNRFLGWYEIKLGYPFDPSHTSLELINSFKEESLSNYSASSVERSISSLRKFFAFLKSEGKISQSPFEAKNNFIRENDIDPWKIRDFKNYLYVLNASNLTIKNYVIDVNQFRNWLETTMITADGIKPEANTLLRSINSKLLDDYKHRLLNDLHLSPVSVNRKLSSLRKYITWATEQGLIRSHAQVLNEAKLNTPVFIPKPIEIPEETQAQIPFAYSNFPPLRLLQKSGFGMRTILDAAVIIPLASAVSRVNHAAWVAKGKPVFENPTSSTFGFSAKDMKTVSSVKNFPKSFYAPTQISTANFPTHMKIWHAARYQRPAWYRKYHSYAFTSYFHLSLLMLTVLGFGYLIFSHSNLSSKNSAVLGTISSSSPRVLTYQGKITDEKGQVINSETNLRMSIYNGKNATGSALLWQEVIPATPNSDGIFNVLLGMSTPIPQEIFSQNPALFLGITVESTPELLPRQQIPTVEMAESAESIQGMVPVTKTKKTENVLLALNSSGNLTIGGNANPVFQATGGSFTVTGQTVVISTNPQSNGNIVLDANGNGSIDIHNRIQNTSIDNSVYQGSVFVDDTLVVSTGTGTQAVLGINQNLTGDLIIASVSGGTRFLVDNGGNVEASGNINGLEILGGTITNGAWKGGLISPTYGGTGLNTSTSTGIPIISNGTWSIDSNSLAPNHGGTGMTGYSTGDLIYASSPNSLGRISIAGAGNCLMSNGSVPLWTTCPSSSSTPTSKWTQGLGSIFPNNSTQDFIIGGNSTSSAKFAVLNVSGNLATATISGNLIVMPEDNVGGNSGFGTANPESRVQISGGGLCVGSDADCNTDNNTQGVIYAASTTTTVYDVAENYPTRDESLSVGEVVEMDMDRGVFVKRNTKAYNPLAIGAISEKPGLLLGGFNGAQFKEEKQVPIALSGRIIIKASNENGAIKQGDFVTSAATPGKVMKATEEGPVIGQALEDWDEDKEGVMVFIKSTYNNPDKFIASSSELTLRENLDETITLLRDSKQVKKIGGYSEIVVAKMKAGYLELGRLTVNTANIAFAKIGELSVNSLAIASEDVTIAGTNIRDYIYSIVDSRISERKVAISSPILEEDIIKPNSNKISIKLPTNDKNSKIEVLNAYNSAVASIDASGDASFAGTLTSNGIQTEDASISGTLRAGKIIADQIELSEEVLAKLEGIEISTSSPTINNNYISNNYYYSSTESASFNSSLASTTRDEDIGSLTVGTGTFTSGLISFGPTSFFEVSVAERLFIGAQLSISGKSINVLGANLELQPLRQGGVSIAGGLVEIDTDGNLRVDGNAYFAKNAEINGKLLTGIIAPIPGKDLIFDFANASDENSKVEFRTGTGSAVLTFNDKGDVNASGAGTFNKLNLSFIPKAIAVSDTVIIATGSAGTAEIKPYKNELTIQNPLITKDSLIYITPKTNTPNQSVYLLRQVPENSNQNGIEGSFTVGLSKAIEKSVPFNWILIN